MNNKSTEYANALYELAIEENIEKEVYDSLQMVHSVFEDNRDYITLLSSRNIPKKDRVKIIEESLSNKVHEYVCSFVCLLCEKEIISIFDDCFKEYKKMYNLSQNVLTAQVKSAVPLSETQMKHIVAKLEKITGRNVTVDCIVDKSLIGGIAIYIDGKVIDNSIKHKLSEIKEVMNSEPKI